MMIMEAFPFAVDIFVAETKQGAIASLQRPFYPNALESKLSLIGLNRLILDQAKRCVNITPMKIRSNTIEDRLPLM